MFFNRVTVNTVLQNLGNTVTVNTVLQNFGKLCLEYIFVS